jgi:hypothetical protein
VNAVGVQLEDKKAGNDSARAGAARVLLKGIRHVAPCCDTRAIGRRSVATVPKILAAILNETIPIGMLMLPPLPWHNAMGTARP